MMMITTPTIATTGDFDVPYLRYRMPTNASTSL